MNMDYEPMWAVVDAHRRCADELERTLKEITGDQPVELEHERDDISVYNFAMRALIEARDQLNKMADREGHSVRRLDASHCRVFARRCDAASNELSRQGEL